MPSSTPWTLMGLAAVVAVWTPPVLARSGRRQHNARAEIFVDAALGSELFGEAMQRVDPTILGHLGGK
jgi:hypothetical protein